MSILQKLLNILAEPSEDADVAKTHAERRQAIATTVEGIAKSCTESLNARNFSTSAAGWDQMADDWKAESEHPEGGWIMQNVSEHLEMQKQIAEANPEYHVRLVDLSTEIDEQARKADVFMTVEATGIPVGMVRKSVGISTFRLLDGKWLCVRYSGARGSVGDE